MLVESESDGELWSDVVDPMCVGVGLSKTLWPSAEPSQSGSKSSFVKVAGGRIA